MLLDGGSHDPSVLWLNLNIGTSLLWGGGGASLKHVSINNGQNSRPHIFCTPPTICHYQVRYEDILSSPAQKVGEILDFLQFPYTPGSLKRQLSHDFTTFQRRHPPRPFEHFTEEQRLLIKSTVTNTAVYLSRSVGSSFGVEKYIREPSGVHM